MAAGDTAAVFTAISKAKARCHLTIDAPVRSCYEAGRDGFWLRRCLEAHQITNLVVDSASIEVNRRRRRVKTDRLDSDKLLSMLMRYYGGERRAWAVARIPTPEQEDERRVHRELARLRQERTAHSNRIRSLLYSTTCGPSESVAARGRTGGRSTLHSCCLPCAPRSNANSNGCCSLPGQIRALEVQQQREVRSGAQPAIARLALLAGIGTGSAWVLIRELFGWRQFHNRREVAGCLGLAPTPYASGTSEVEQGISKIGNKRARWLMVELVALPAQQPAKRLVQRALCRRRQAYATHRHCGTCQTSGGRAMAHSARFPSGQPSSPCEEGDSDLSSQRRAAAAFEGSARPDSKRVIFAGDRSSRWGASIRGGSSALRMRYVVPGLVPERIEVGPVKCPDFRHPDLTTVLA
nr:transposase [Paraburkholderia nodosa]